MPIKSRIRTIPDYPRAGIMFRDITTLLQDPLGFRKTVDELVQPYAGKRVDKVAGIEARGFIVGGAVAHQLSTGFVPVRKKGKLPHAAHAEEYVLEYGTNTLEIHQDALSAGERVLIVDDLLATGGTARATTRLVAMTGAEVAGLAFLLELSELSGRGLLDGFPVDALITY